jgi:ABC-type nitrate/sulfonate/bicarbonate transport system permease component
VTGSEPEVANPLTGAAPGTTDDRIEDRPTIRNWIRAAVPPLLFALLVLVAWEVLVIITGISALLLPAPSQIMISLVDNADLFVRNAIVTLGEILIGFALGACVGIALGIALSYSRIFERSVYPWLVASQMVPIVAVAPILVVWFGFTLVPKVLVVALISFFPVVVNTVDGLQSVDRLKIAMALAVVGAVFGEWVGSSSGLGYLMLAFNNQLATTDLFAAVIVLSAMGIALFFLVGGVERLVIPWHHEKTRAGR